MAEYAQDTPDLRAQRILTLRLWLEVAQQNKERKEQADSRLHGTDGALAGRADRRADQEA